MNRPRAGPAPADLWLLLAGLLAAAAPARGYIDPEPVSLGIWLDI